MSSREGAAASNDHGCSYPNCIGWDGECGGTCDGKPPAEQPAATTRLWVVNVTACFEADNPEDAAAIARRLTERVLEHPDVWGATGEFDPEQTTEVVDAPAA